MIVNVSLPLKGDTSDSHVSPVSMLNRSWHTKEQTPIRRRATTPPSPEDDRYLSSPTTPNLARTSQKSQDQNLIRSLETTNLQKESRNPPLDRLSIETTPDKTARRAAESAQDTMLVQAGLQKSPSQLIERVITFDDEMPPLPTTSRRHPGVCDDCRSKKVRRGVVYLSLLCSFDHILDTLPTQTCK